MAHNSILLGIDFGLKKVGLALAREGIAAPLKTIPNDKNMLSQIVQICSQEQVTEIVVGAPEGNLLPQVEQFVSKLKLNLSIPIIFQDEVLTTKMAERERKENLFDADDNALSATILLREYLAGTAHRHE